MTTSRFCWSISSVKCFETNGVPSEGIPACLFMLTLEGLTCLIFAFPFSSDDGSTKYIIWMFLEICVIIKTLLMCEYRFCPNLKRLFDNETIKSCLFLGRIIQYRSNLVCPY